MWATFSRYASTSSSLPLTGVMSLRETVTEDPSVIAEYLYEWDYAEPGQPITDELIELYLSQEPIEIDLPDPRRGGFDRLPGR